MIAYSLAVAVPVAVSAIILFRAAYGYHPSESVGSSLVLLSLALPALIVPCVGLAFGQDLRASAELGAIAAAPFLLCMVAAVPVAALGFFNSNGRVWPQRVLVALGIGTVLNIPWLAVFASAH